MMLLDARTLADRLMTEYGLEARHWKFQFDNARKRFGYCKFNRGFTRAGDMGGTISLSKHLVALNDESHVRDTILHEIAHALSGPRAGHSRIWKLQAIKVGASPSRLYSTAGENPVIQPPATWVGTCPKGHITRRFKKPRESSCGKCSRSFDRQHLFTWVRGGDN